MNDITVARWAGAFGLATVIFWLSQFPLYTIGHAPSVYDGQAYAVHLKAISSVAFTRIILDLGVYASMMVFAAGMRHLIRSARQDYEWLGTLLFGSAIVWLAVTLVADGLAGGAVLDAISSQPDPGVVRALILATILIYNSATAFAMTALFLLVAGFATLGTQILPAWTACLAFVGAALCIACVPAIYGGPTNYTGFTAGSFVPALMANFPPAIWFATVSIMLLRKRDT
jgi:hypothetical protein